MKKAAPKKTVKLDFGHSPETIQFWKRLAREALSLSSTPLYIFSSEPVAQRIAEFDAALVAAGFHCDSENSKGKLSFRHWLSFKTQPVRPLLRWWREQGRPVEVVSEFELRAALAEGFAPENILVNGPAKHHWLPQFDLRELSVHFDSPGEIVALGSRAKKLNWRTGIRILTNEEFDPENPEYPTQFGFTPEEAVAALKALQKMKVRAESVHFHLRTNVTSVKIYERAIAEIAGICREAKFSPKYLDVGGGVPVRHVLTRGGKVFNGEFGLRAFAERLRQADKLFPDLREVWLENGRFISAPGGVLVVKILEMKERRGVRQFICDGGRTLNALTSLWEQHELLPLEERSGADMLTVVHGPTCMAFDQLARIPLPRSLIVGDHLIWFDAGAYHVPWETRFSHGHAAICWHDGQGLRVTRERQAFEDWWPA